MRALSRCVVICIRVLFRLNIQVFHSGDSDALWLQRDFGVYLVNVFDTYWAMRHLEYAKLSYAHLVDTMCDVQLDKQATMSDWRLRYCP